MTEETLRKLFPGHLLYPDIGSVCNLASSSIQVSRHSIRVGSGITRLSWPGEAGGGSGRRDVALAATLDGLVRLVDVRGGKVLADCSGHSAAVLDMAVAK